MTYVFTGPIFESPEIEKIGAGQVSVPTHTFKVILVLQGTRKTIYAAIVPNAEAVREPLNQFAVTVAEVASREVTEEIERAGDDTPPAPRTPTSAPAETTAQNSTTPKA